MENKYYVYGLYEEGVELPFYIGKGCGRRVKRYALDGRKAHSYILDCKFKNLKRKNKKLESKILHMGLSEKEALEIERELIKQYGKRCDNTGILFNFTDGGDQPPSVHVIKSIYGDEKYNEILKKRNITYYANLYVKNFEEVLKIEKLLNEDYLIKDIAKKLGKDRNTISKWIRMYNLKYDDTKKRLLEIERLQSFTKQNSEKIQKTSNKYLVVDPDGNETWVSKLVLFCRERNLDYKGLRNTFNKFKKDGNNCTCKKYWIKEVVNPNS